MSFSCMKVSRFLCKIHIVFFALLVAGQAAAQESKTIRVMSYNIHHCSPPSRNTDYIDVDATAAAINRGNPDLVALQEVEAYTNRANGSLPEQLSVKTGLPYCYFAGAINRDTGRYGNAVLSRYPLLGTYNIELPNPNTDGEKRCIAAILIELPGGKKVLFAGMHFDLKEVNKQAQADTVTGSFRTDFLSEVPLIIAGDLNAKPGGYVVNKIGTYYQRTCTDCLPTNPNGGTIDHIAFAPKNAFSILTHDTVKNDYASDHYPIYADLQYTIETQESPRVIYTSVDGSGSKDGSSWINSAEITAAVALAKTNKNHQVWLKKGTYYLSTTINFDSLFIYGGFAGIETQMNERNWVKNQTILDGRDAIPLLQNSVDAARLSGNTSYIPCLLDGVIIQNGLGSSATNGGAMIINNGAHIRNCIFRNNRTQNGMKGGAIHCHRGSLLIENSLFVNNTSVSNGGAIQIGGGTNALIINCTLANNLASGGPGGAIGTGSSSSHLEVNNTVMYNNNSSSGYNSYGQNTNINGGGDIVSRYSAIETTSTKFVAGRLNHIQLTRSKSPQFENPSSVIGKGTTQAEVEDICAASYQLAASSPCVDAGDNKFVNGVIHSLGGGDRIHGVKVDMGAYEYGSSSPVYTEKVSQPEIRSFVLGDELYVSNVHDNVLVRIYNSQGVLIGMQPSEEGKNIVFRLNSKGVYLILAGNSVAKVVY